MLENEKQRRWWFANHPEYSSSRTGAKRQSRDDVTGREDKPSPQEVDEYVDYALQHLDGPLAVFLQLIKRNFGTQGYADEHDGSGNNRDTESRSGQQEEPYPTIGPAPPPTLGDHARSVLDFVLPGFTKAYDRWRTGYYKVYPWAPGPAYDALPGLAVLVGTGLAGIQASLARAASASEIAALQSARQELLKLWELPYCHRGDALEILLGRNLHKNFECIDRWVDGVATSIKTMDLRLKSYQTAEQILSRGRGYVHKVAKFNGARMEKVDITGDKIVERVLRFGVHPEFNNVQEAALKSLIQYGKKMRSESGGFQSTMKRLEAYKKDKKVYLNPMSKTTTGLWIGTFPQIILGETEPFSNRGKYLRECLEFSREGLPHPKDWDAFLEPFLKKLGVKSWSVFARNALSCAIELKEDEFVFLPYRNSGPKGHYNFLPLEERKMTISGDATDEELGLLLEKAFDACE